LLFNANGLPQSLAPCNSKCNFPAFRFKEIQGANEVYGCPKRAAFVMLDRVLNSEITIRAITDVAEMRAVEDLQQAVWGVSEREVVSFMMFIPTLAVGGLLLGAWDGAKLIGFSYAFPGREDGRVILHSDMLAVLPEYRDQQLGYRLKLAQREHALAAGIETITWTFDPLQSRNAHLNFGKLGVIGTDYKIDFYGPSSSPLHQGGTDRLWLHWALRSERVCERISNLKSQISNLNATNQPRLVRVAADGQPELRPQTWESGPEVLSLEIPLVIAEWQKANPSLVARWRETTRRAFTQAFEQGYFVAEFYPLHFEGAGCGEYMLRRPLKPLENANQL
jgi:predicted GNAT superfamily acetyltransferase